MWNNVLYILFLPILLAFVYGPNSSNNHPFHDLRSNTPLRILLLTAHPDDECLFFAPTIQSLLSIGRVGQSRSPTLDSTPEIYSLCLSSGNADGLGKVRQIELQRSLNILGINDENQRVEDHPHLQDNITASWDPDVIADVLEPYVLEHKITTILTFDSGGISGHPNHVSLPLGVQNLMKRNLATAGIPPRLFTLISVPLVTKYNSILAPILAKFDLVTSQTALAFEQWIIRTINHFGVEIGPVPQASPRMVPVFVSGVPEYLRALNAMRMHQTQLVWFRWLNVLFSRYMWVNEWVEIQITL
ncbi:putative deacetylase LmbE-like domain-containing protein [Infundibulicybe gibba]|nr:putative deacetylase LmbE-like domain-containing protein [Infundibulicybe gibba]